MAIKSSLSSFHTVSLCQRTGARIYSARTALLLIMQAWLLFAPASGFAQGRLEQEWPNTDFTQKTIDLGEVTSGGPPKDGIPAIDKPRYENYQSADRWLNEREPVIALSIDDKVRAYPLRILIYHEIVNDKLAQVPVSVTFCPLCNASMVFDRRLKGSVLDFGTTGRLRKSDLIMYDRQTQSWWQQFTGEGIVGQYAGVTLKRLPSSIVSYQDFKSAYPDGDVLSQNTGFHRSYGKNPYRGYDRVGQSPFLFSDALDPRLPAMERVLSVSHNGVHRLYPFSVLRKHPVVNDTVNDFPVVVFSYGALLSVLDKADIVGSRDTLAATTFSRRVDGKILGFEVRNDGIYDRETATRWNLLGQATEGPLQGRQLQMIDGGVHFAFAWLAFHPDSGIYQPKKP